MTSADSAYWLFADALHSPLVLHALPSLTADDLAHLACTSTAGREWVSRVDFLTWRDLAAKRLPMAHPVLSAEQSQVRSRIEATVLLQVQLRCASLISKLKGVSHGIERAADPGPLPVICRHFWQVFELLSKQTNCCSSSLVAWQISVSLSEVYTLDGKEASAVIVSLQPA